MNKDPLYPLRRLHGILHEKKEDIKEGIRFSKEFNKRITAKKEQESNFIYLIMTPSHSNLGDHAIALAEKKILETLKIPYLEITTADLAKMKKYRLLKRMNGNTIIFNGGGNLGTLWLESAENVIRKTIKNNKESKIVVFPNTIFYEDSVVGRQELQKSIKIYNSHPNLHLYARENISYEFMKDKYRNVELVPDMVLSLNRCKEYTVRSGCLLCLRSDREKTLSDAETEIIREQAAVLFGDNVKDTDMLYHSPVSIEDREMVLEEKFEQFRSAELVITDRLHGMIFCAITGTPCLVVDSKSPKVRGCYEWIRNLNYIRFVDQVSGIAEEYRKIPQEIHMYNNSHLMPYYEKLAQDIRKLFGR